MFPRHRPITRLYAFRTVAALLVAVMAVGARVTPARAAGTGCSACVRDAKGNVSCRHVAASAQSKSHSCCKGGGSSEESRPSTPCGSESDGCACPGRQCCLIQGSAPPVFAVTHDPVRSFSIPSVGLLCPTVLPSPAGVHESVFHPPRA